MPHHDVGREGASEIKQLGSLVDMDQELDMPTKRRDALSYGPELVKRSERHPALVDEVHADAACAGVMHPAQLRVLDRAVDGHHGPEALRIGSGAL
jgi:hypothetical protein